MKRVISLAAAGAAIFALTAGAEARPPKPTTIQIDGFCATFDVWVARDTITGSKIDVTVTAGTDSCEALLGEGFAGKVGTAKTAAFGGILGGDATTIWTVVLSYPFATGGSAIVYNTTDGITMNLVAQSTYTVLSPATASVKGGKRFALSK